MPDPFALALSHTDHRPWPMPARPWRLRQRWNDLLFAHWPIAPEQLAARLPAGLVPDLYDGQAWLGVVPFWMDQVQTRTFGSGSIQVPTTRSFNELNLRTYVRSARTGRPGVFFYSLDCDSYLSVLGARTIFHLPYFPAAITRTGTGPIDYISRRQFTRTPATFEATFTPTGPVMGPARPGSLTHFLTERYALFTPFAGRMLVGQIHHDPWPLQPAEVEIRLNEIPAAHGFTLPATPPLLHFSRELYVNLWSLKPDAKLPYDVS